MIHILEQVQVLPLSMEAAWTFFSSPANLDEITPPELAFQTESGHTDPMHEGQIVIHRVKVAPGVHVRWVTEIKAVDEGRAFVDEQRFGPYKFWHHRHTFEPVDGGVRMCDRVHYELPFGPLGELVHALFVRQKLERIFAFRREELARRFPAGGRSA